MAKFPQPPGVEALQAMTPQLAYLNAGERVFRIFKTSGNHPVAWDEFRYFGPTGSRFDHHLRNPQGKPFKGERGIIYGATGGQNAAITTCLAEFFQANRIIDRKSGEPVLSAFAVTERLTLLDLRGPFATQIGASMAINTGPRPRAQRWAQQLYEAYANVHGVIYPSSMHANKPAVALWERSFPCMPKHPDFHRYLTDSALNDVIEMTAPAIGYILPD